MDRPPHIEEGVPLHTLCTLELGGPARYLITAPCDQTVVGALRWAAAAGLDVVVLGGGSNLVIADEGFSGLVLRMAQRGVQTEAHGDRVLLTAQAGEPWDDVVALAVSRGLMGLECLSGIPGLSGATPIQNVGAYGQEVADTLHSVRVLCRDTLEVRELGPADCAFGYRDSCFKRHPTRFIVLGVTFALTPGGAPVLRYPEVGRALAGTTAPTLAQVRQAVLTLRRSKSMVLSPEDENRRSVGSFFMNPVLPVAEAQAVVSRAVAAGIATGPQDVPHYPAAGGQAKLSAAWLIEKAGIRKGERHGHVGISSRHALALVHHGGGRTTELIELMGRVRAAVAERFGVVLQPEPVFLGFDRT